MLLVSVQFQACSGYKFAVEVGGGFLKLLIKKGIDESLRLRHERRISSLLRKHRHSNYAEKGNNQSFSHHGFLQSTASNAGPLTSGD